MCEFEDLTDEILTEIFGYLSPKLLKVSILVCKRWHELITQNTRLMKSFKYNVTNGCFETPRRIQGLVMTRKLCAVETLNLYDLRSVELTSLTLYKEELVEALRSLKNLENLSADSLRLHESSEQSEVTRVQLTKLKSLNLRFSSIHMLSTFSTSSLRNFSIQNLEHQSDSKILCQLLQEQDCLVTLDLAGTICEDFFRRASHFKFSLKSLTVTKFNLQTDEVSEIFWEFLKLQKSSIEELKISNIVSNTLKKKIFTEMPSLTSVELSFGSENLSELKNIAPIFSVRRLKMLGFMKNVTSVTNILKLFPSLKSLDLSQLTIKTPQDFCSIFDFIHRNYHSIQELHFQSLSFYDEDCEKFTHLKEFHVGKITSEDFYNLFLRDHASTLERISIGCIKDDAFVRGLTVSAINHCRKLRHISFTSETSVVPKMFNKIKRDHPFQWILESKFFINESKDVKKVVFKFPDDEAVFSERCQIWDDTLIRELTTVSSNYGLNAFINKFK